MLCQLPSRSRDALWRQKQQQHRQHTLGHDLPRRGQVVLQRVGHVVAVAKVEVGGHVHGEEHLEVASLVGVALPALVVGDVAQVDVLHLVDAVVSDHGRLAPLGDEDDVVALQEPDEACGG